MPWIGAVVGAGASLLGGAMSSNAASGATKASLQAAREATAEQRRQFDLTRADMRPWYETGLAANSQLARLLGINTAVAPTAPLAKDYTTTEPGHYTQESRRMLGRGSDVAVTPSQFVPGKTLFNQGGYDSAMAEYQRKKAEYDANNAEFEAAKGSGYQGEVGSLLRKFQPGDLTNEPGYKFQLEQGQQAIDRAAAARGNRYSGSTLKELLRFNTGLADSTYNNAWNRDAQEKQRIYGMLSGQAGTGQSTAGMLGQLGANTANNISDITLQAGNARAAGIVGQTNAITSGIGDALSFWNQYQWMKPKTNTSSGGYTSNINPLSPNEFDFR